MPAFRLDAIADIGYRAELLEQEAGQGLVLPRRRQRDLQQIALDQVLRTELGPCTNVLFGYSHKSAALSKQQW